MTDSIDINSIKQITTSDKYAPRTAQMGTIGLLSDARDFPKLKISGLVELQIRQPLIGKINKGGLRLGELESDADIEYGINTFSREILMDVSDEY